METPSASAEYAIKLAVVGILVAIGVPALQRGELMLGTAMLVAAVVVAAWVAYAWFMARNLARRDRDDA